MWIEICISTLEKEKRKRTEEIEKRSAWTPNLDPPPERGKGQGQRRGVGGVNSRPRLASRLKYIRRSKSS